MKISLRIRKLWHFEVLQIFKNWIIYRVPGRTTWTQRSAGNSFCQAHAFQSGHLLQLITNSSFVWFIGQNFIASQILSSKIISWNFICNAKGIFKSWECYRSQPFAGNKHARSHCQFSCQARTFTSFCRAHNKLCKWVSWWSDVITSQFSIHFVHRSDKNIIFQLWEC